MFLAIILPSSYYTLETSEMSAFFVFTTKITQPRPQVFLVNGCCTFDVIASLIAKFFQIWSLLVGYGELCMCF